MTRPVQICLPPPVFQAIEPGLHDIGWTRFDDGCRLDRYRWNQKVVVYQRQRPDGAADEIAVEFSNIRGIGDVLIWGAASTIEADFMPLINRAWAGGFYDLSWDDGSNPFRRRDGIAKRFGFASNHRFTSGLIRCETYAPQGLCSPDEETLIVNLHGTFGNSAGSTDKYRRLARSLVCRLAGDVLLYSSSRDWAQEDARILAKDSSYAAKMAAFIHDGAEKTFLHELADARRVLAHALRGRPRGDHPRVVLIGHSLGGLLAFFVAKAFPAVDTIISVGTGLRRTLMDVPILRTLPPPEMIKRVTGGFRGTYIMHQAGADDTFSPDDYDVLYDAVGKAKTKTRLLHDGADHAFKTLDDRGAPRFDEIIRHVSGGLAPQAQGEPRHWPPTAPSSSITA